MKITDLFTARSIAMNRAEVASNRIPYLGEGYFPSQKKLGIDLSWIKSYKGLPVALAPSAFDALATIRPREGFSIAKTEMPLFRESMVVKEKDMIDIMRIQDADDPFANEVLRSIYDDTNTLLDGADVATERMRMQLLAAENGDVKISVGLKDNTIYNYNYDPNGDWKTDHYVAITSPADKWNVSTSKPLDDINNRKKFLRAKGYNPTDMVMTTNTFNNMMASQQIKDAIVSLSGNAITYVNDAIVADVVSRATQMGIVLYDKQFKDYDGTTKQFFPDGYVSFIGVPTLGGTWYGTTPEERTLIGDPKVNVSLVDTGVAVAVQEHYGPPVSVSTTVSQIVLPSYENMDAVSVVKVY